MKDKESYLQTLCWRWYVDWAHSIFFRQVRLVFNQKAADPFMSFPCCNMQRRVIESLCEKRETTRYDVNKCEDNIIQSMNKHSSNLLRDGIVHSVETLRCASGNRVHFHLESDTTSCPLEVLSRLHRHHFCWQGTAVVPLVPAPLRPKHKRWGIFEGQDFLRRSRRR